MILIQEIAVLLQENRKTRITRESRSAFMWTSKGARGTTDFFHQ
jgi:hypothetical protein